MKTTFILLTAVGAWTIPELLGEEATKRSETTGTVAEVVPGIIAVRTPDQAHPVRYTFSKTTKWVDENGRDILRESLKIGTPVRVIFTKQGIQSEATQVVIRKPDVAQP